MFILNIIFGIFCLIHAQKWCCEVVQFYLFMEGMGGGGGWLKTIFGVVCVYFEGWVLIWYGGLVLKWIYTNLHTYMHRYVYTFICVCTYNIHA